MSMSDLQVYAEGEGTEENTIGVRVWSALVLGNWV